jgi:DNA-binding GntR family transcriptional regulator
VSTVNGGDGAGPIIFGNPETVSGASFPDMDAPTVTAPPLMPSSTDLKLLPLTRDASDAEPLYAAIRKSLILSIRKDPAAVGKNLPIEREIAEHYDVSKLTVRQAIELLEREGYVAKRRGKPSEICSQTARVSGARPLQRMSDILALHSRRDSRVLSYTRRQSAPAAQLLQLPEDAWLYCLRLEQFCDQGKLGLTEAYLPEEIGRHLTREHFEEAARQGTLYVFPLVERETGHRAERARVTIGATDLLQVGDHEVSQLMDNRPLVRLQFVFYSQHQVPCQLTINWFDSRYYSVTYDLGG